MGNLVNKIEARRESVWAKRREHVAELRYELSRAVAIGEGVTRQSFRYRSYAAWMNLMGLGSLVSQAITRR